MDNALYIPVKLPKDKNGYVFAPGIFLLMASSVMSIIAYKTLVLSLLSFLAPLAKSHKFSLHIKTTTHIDMLLIFSYLAESILNLAPFVISCLSLCPVGWFNIDTPDTVRMTSGPGQTPDTVRMTNLMVINIPPEEDDDHHHLPGSPCLGDDDDEGLPTYQEVVNTWWRQ